jgi:hypothetical protein
MMLRPSADAVPLLARIVARSPSLVSRVFGHLRGAPELVPAPKGALAEALSGLERLGDYRVIPYLAWLLEFPEAELQSAQAIGRLMPNSTQSLTRLDEGMRVSNYCAPLWWPKDTPFPFPPIGGISVETATRILRSSPKVPVMGLLSFAGNGRVREAALKALSDARGGEEVPFLLLRLNDWVQPVAEQARKAVIARLTAEYSTHLAQRLALVDRVGAQNRRDHSLVIAELEKLFTQTEAGRAAVLRQISGGEWDNKRSAIALVARCWPEGCGAPEELRRALADNDGVVRNQAIVVCERLFTSIELEALVVQLASDSSALIRRKGFAIAERRFPAVADRLAEVLLFDSNTWLREFSRQRLKSHGEADFAERYRRALSTPDKGNSSGALLGLMETGMSVDAKFVARFLPAPRKTTRLAALRATCALAPADAEGPLVDALASEGRALSGLARDLLRTSRYTVSISRIVALIESPHVHVRSNALRLIHAADKWKALLLALRLRGDKDAAVAKYAMAIVDWWRSIPPALYSVPSAGQRAELRDHFDSDVELSPIRKNIEFMLGGPL